jgi:hypothetical protein
MLERRHFSKVWIKVLSESLSKFKGQAKGRPNRSPNVLGHNIYYDNSR